MGSGCSSPLKRFGGKRGKPRRESSIFDLNGDKNENNQENTIAARLHQQSGGDGSSSSHRHYQHQQHKFIIENETTIQSEINEDHPSTASYYTDGRANTADDQARIGADASTRGKPTPCSSSATIGQPGGPQQQQPSSAGLAAARAMGLTNTYVPIDRHLLVSPALSPAPSVACHSPSPGSINSSSAGTILDLHELNEAFKTIIFGLPNGKIKQPEERQNLDCVLNNNNNNSSIHYTHQQLVQNKSDLINCISVVFVTIDSNPNQPSTQMRQLQQSTANANDPQVIESIIANKVESSLKTFCDEHSFSLKFLNLNHEHLCKSFHVNNLLDMAMNVINREYQHNGQRLVIITLSNNWAAGGSGLDQGSSSAVSGGGGGAISGSCGGGKQPNNRLLADKRQLPSKIDAQIMNKLLNVDLSSSDIDKSDQFSSLMRKWYSQVGTSFYLAPIYAVYPQAMGDSFDEREAAWQNWLSDSSLLKKIITYIQETNAELNDSKSDFKLKYLSNQILEFIMNESSLQKRTLLIRNYSLATNQAAATGSGNQLATTSGQVSTTSGGLHQQSSVKHRDASLNELARLLADTNKLTLKRPMGEEELVKTINDWIIENFNKFVESIQENQIIYGKHVPPFIERNLFIELTCQRLLLEDYLNNITETYETKCRNFYIQQIYPVLSPMISGEVNNIVTLDQQQQQQPADTLSSSATSATPSSTPEPRQLSNNHLIFVSGLKGCGKSTLFAQLIRLATQDLFNKSQIIYRFCGQTLDSLHPNRLLRSICEQFCQTQNENITAASYIYSSQRGEIINALNKIIKMQNSILFLDGIDQFELANPSNNSSLDWLCELEANPRVKIFIMLEVDSHLYKKVLSSYSDATFISLDNPTTSEWAQMLTLTARQKRLYSTGNLYEELKNLNFVSSATSGGEAAIGSSLPEDQTQLTYRDVDNIISMCRIRMLNNEHSYPELSTGKINQIDNLKNIQQVVISHLQYLMPPYQLCALFIAIDSSRNGLSESDIVNIMTMISKTKPASLLSSSSSESNLHQWKFSTTLFNYLKIQLHPWLTYILCNGVVKITIKRDFLKAAIAHFVPNKFPNILTEVREILLDYFSRQVRPSRSSILSAIKGVDNNPMELKDNVSPSESLWLATQASETMNLLILTDPSKAREHILNKHQFFFQFLYGSMPEEFIEDCERLNESSQPTGSRKPSYVEELNCLGDYIKQSVYPLRYDGSQIYSQIYCRTYDSQRSSKFPKSKKFSDILTTASCPPLRNLLPISETSVNSFIKTRIGPVSSATGSANSQSSVSSTSQQANTRSTTSSGYQSGPPLGGPPNAAGGSQAKQRIFNIKDNHRHVIVIHPDKGSLCVWDIYEERAVRSINNLDQPRDLRMIDHKRAVVLCNRELLVYDLDSGVLLTKLKGVMNQKMPFFEVFGDNYVVALARNRMYVNMLNLNTGELETTFKVGEDRFLNSLLVSANGGICVCGDETQKPFPLLVWNLNERRLMYDLRLDRHEFITRMSAISDDGHFVVSVCRQLGDSTNNDSSTNGSTSAGDGMAHSNSGTHLTGGGLGRSSSPNFIVIYDLNSGTLFKKWKPGLDTCAVAISLPANKPGKVVNSIVDSSILIWDLSTASKR